MPLPDFVLLLDDMSFNGGGATQHSLVAFVNLRVHASPRNHRRHRTQTMNAIKAIRKQLEKNPDAPSSKALARLVAALAEEKSYSLADLYSMDYDAFEMALELLRDWRLDRYYAARLKLFDFALSTVIPETKTDGGGPAASKPQPAASDRSRS